MPMNRASFKKQLQDGLNTVWGMEQNRYPEQWRPVFEIYNSDKAYEEDVLMVGLGAAPVKAEGAGVTYDEGGESWVSRYVHETIAMAFSITEEAVEDGRYGDVSAKYVRAMVQSFRHTKELKGAAILNNAFSGVTYGDGKALCATDHPLWNGDTLSNTFTTQADLSEASLEDALIAISNFKDDRGIPVATTAQRLVHGPSLTFVAERLLQSQLRPGTADNDVNASRSMGMLPQGSHVLQRLTDTNAWFILTDASDGLKHFVRKAMKKGMEGDFETGNLRYKGRERYSFGCSNYRAIYGSSGVS